MVNGEGRQRMHLMIIGLALLAHEVLRLALRVEVVHLRSSSVNGDVCDDRCLGHQSRITSEAHARCANQRVHLLRQRALAHDAHGDVHHLDGRRQWRIGGHAHQGAQRFHLLRKTHAQCHHR